MDELLLLMIRLEVHLEVNSVASRKLATFTVNSQKLHADAVLQYCCINAVRVVSVGVVEGLASWQ